MKQGAYIYTRVSTAIQTEGYSLEAQRQKVLDYAKYRGFVIKGEYSDAGFSGKNISGRVQFQQMMEDIANKKDGVKYVLVFKLSRFGRNAADVLSSLQFMQDYGVNLICVEDNIDSSADSGKLMISVMSAMAEIERENILVQTMAGRRQKASNGGWNGGFAPYGYELQDGQLVVVEDEARVIRDTFQIYVESNKGATFVAKELNKRYTKKIKLPTDVSRFTNDFVKRIIDNPVYMGKIAYGRTVSEKIEGKRNEFHRIVQKDSSKIIWAEGDHEAIVSEEVWETAHRMREEKAFRPEKIDKEHYYVLSGLVRCPECGQRMYGRINGKKKKKDGTLYPSSYSYVCRTRFAETGKDCKKAVSYSEKKLVQALRGIIVALVKDDGFDDLVNKSLNEQLDTDALTNDLEAAGKEMKRLQRLQQHIENQLNSLDYENKNAEKLEASLNGRLLQVLEDIATTEERIVDISERLENAETIQQTKQGIYAFLKHFNAVFDAMEDEDKRAFLKSFIDSIEVYPKKRNGQLIKMIHFRFPMATKEGKEYSSVFFDDGSGSDFPTLTDDCLYIYIGSDQLRAANLCIGGRIQGCLGIGG